MTTYKELNEYDSNGNAILQAPKNKYRVVGVDTFAHEDFVIGDYDTLETAIRIAKKQGGTMMKVYIYNDKSKYLFDCGKF
jgi:hypothetical protein